MNAHEQFLKWRRALVMTQSEVGKFLDLDARQVRRMELGESSVHRSHLLHLERLFLKCYTSSPVQVLQEVIGKRTYLGRSWMYPAKPREQYLLIESEDKPGQIAILCFDPLSAVHVRAKEQEIRYPSVDRALASAMSVEAFRLQDSPWPDHWYKQWTRV